MTVINNTPVDLEILETRLKPNEVREYPTDSFTITSDIGRIKVKVNHMGQNLRSMGKIKFWYEPDFNRLTVSPW